MRPKSSAIVQFDAAADQCVAAYASTLASEGIAALAFIPVVHAGRLLGKFMLYYDAPHDFSEEEVLIAGTVASHVAAAAARQKEQDRLADSELRLRLAITTPS